MKFTISSETLRNTLNSVSAVALKIKVNEDPFLSCVLIDVKEGTVDFSCHRTNSKITVRHHLKTEHNGRIAVNVEKLTKICQSAGANTEITLSGEKESVSVLVGSTHYKIKTFPIRELLFSYPNQEAISGAVLVDDLISGIAQTVFAAPLGDNNHLPCALKLEATREHLTFVGTDGHRLAKSTKPWLSNSESLASICIARNTLGFITQGLRSIDGSIYIRYNTKCIEFSADDFSLLLPVVETPYPPYEKAFPKTTHGFLVSNHSILKSALQRAVTATDSVKSKIICRFQENEMEITAEENGEQVYNDSIDITYEGKEVAIGYNSRYLLDTVNAVNDEELCLYLNSGEAATVIHGKNDLSKATQYLVMPMRI